MDSIDEDSDVLGLVAGKAAVTQIGDVADLVSSVASQHLSHFVLDGLRGGEHSERIQVALQGDSSVDEFARLSEVTSPVNRETIEGESRELFDDGVGTLGEANDRSVGACGLNFLDDQLEGGDTELAIQARGQEASPGVEELQDVATSSDLLNHVVGDVLSQASQEFCGRLRMLVQPVDGNAELLLLLLFSRTIDHVAHQRPGSSGEANERHTALQATTSLLDALVRVVQLGNDLISILIQNSFSKEGRRVSQSFRERGKDLNRSRYRNKENVPRLKLSGILHGLSEDRPDRRLHFDVEAKALRNDQDIGEENHSVQGETFQGL